MPRLRRPGGEPAGALEADLLDHGGEEAGGEEVAGAGDVDDLRRQRRHVQVDAAADQARPAAAHLDDHQADAGVEQEVERLGQREAAEHLELGLGGEQVGAALQDRQEALDPLARVDLAGVEGDLDVGGEPLEQRQLGLERLVADEAREEGEAGARQAPAAGRRARTRRWRAGQTRLRRSPSSSSSTYTRPVSPSRCTSRASAGASS